MASGLGIRNSVVQSTKRLQFPENRLISAETGLHLRNNNSRNVKIPVYSEKKQEADVYEAYEVWKILECQKLYHASPHHKVLTKAS
jgi:hypothetical protein